MKAITLAQFTRVMITAATFKPIEHYNSQPFAGNMLCVVTVPSPFV